MSNPPGQTPRTRREAREQAAREQAESRGRSDGEPTAESETVGVTAQPETVAVTDEDETHEFAAVHPEETGLAGFSGWTSEDDLVGHDEHTSYEDLKRQHKRRAGRSCLLLVLVMVLIIGGLGYAASKIGRISLPGMAQGDPDYTGTGTGTVQITVQEGDTGAAIARTLLKAGVVKSTGAFVQVANTSRDFGSIQPGRYNLHRNMSAQTALQLMLDPKSFSSTGVTIPEGLWASQIFAVLSKHTGVPVADYRKVTPGSIGLPAAANGHLEGYLFPSTYNFTSSMSAQQQLRAMADEWRKKVAPLHIPANKLHDVMVVASLVEAESRLPQDGPKVARVIENRVAQGMPLQLDSTIHYAEGKRGTITTTDAERARKGPYNSYLNTGLPPTPIDNPGVNSIKAALHPATGTWLYFVTVDPETGKTLFATTYDQQRKNEQMFHTWCAQHPGKC